MSLAFCRFVVNDIFYVLYAVRVRVRCQRNINILTQLTDSTIVIDIQSYKPYRKEGNIFQTLKMVEKEKKNKQKWEKKKTKLINGGVIVKVGVLRKEKGIISEV